MCVDASSAHQLPIAIKRRAMSIAYVIYSDILDSSEVDAAVAWLETCGPELHSGTTLFGPFGVFPSPSNVSDGQPAHVCRNGTTPGDLDVSSFMAKELPCGPSLPMLEVSQSRQRQSIRHDHALVENMGHFSSMRTPVTLPIFCRALQASDTSLSKAIPPHLRPSA